MKKLLTYLLVLLIVAIGLGWGWFELISKGLRNQNQDYFGKAKEVFRGNTPYDVVFFGSSRTWVQINPAISDSIMGLNTFNVGFDGIRITECAMYMDAWLRTHPAPKLAVLNIDFHQFDTDAPLFKPPQYLPWLKEPGVYDQLAPKSSDLKWAGIFPFWGATHYTDYFRLMGLKALRNPGKSNLYKGFGKGWGNEWAPGADEKLDSSFVQPVTDEGFALLESVVKLYSEKNVPLVLVYGPQYREMGKVVKNFEEIMNRVQGLARKYQIEFMRYDDMEICNSKTYFYNPTHLTIDGANIYTRKLSADLRSYLNAGH